MGGFDLNEYKDSARLKEQLKQKQKDIMENPIFSQEAYDNLTEEEQNTFAMQHLFMTNEEKQEEKANFRMEILELKRQLAENRANWIREQRQYQERELSKNQNDKTLAKLKTPEEIAALREKRQQDALKADKRKIFYDKARHGFYKFVGQFVKMGRRLSKAGRAEKNTTEEPILETKGLLSAYRELDGMKPLPDDADYEAKQAEFQERYGALYADMKRQYEEKEPAARIMAAQKVREEEQTSGRQLTEEERKTAIQKEMERILEAASYEVRFGRNTAANLEGGTKPNAVRMASDGSKWLLKSNHSCIGTAAPNASIMTVAGYRVQNLVDSDTAIEAFESKSRGMGTVSLQRMAENVVHRTKKVNGQDVPDEDYVDLSRFSRTPEAMTPQELEKIEKLAPQFLREFLTDYLLGNHDTKGENFLICREADGQLKVRGIDKEAAGRRDLLPEAQHMQKDKHFFDQDTVYNQLFRKFADGSMDFDLRTVGQYLDRIEEMSTEDYLKIYQPYLERQSRDNPDKFDEIKKNIIYRKENIRVEARRFFAELVRERMVWLPKDEKYELQDKYMTNVDGEYVFRFKGETEEDIRAERQRLADQKAAEERKILEEKAKKADAADEKSYNRRHAMYDFAKTIIMGFKNLKKRGDDYPEQRGKRIKISELNIDEMDNWDESLSFVRAVFKRNYVRILREEGNNGAESKEAREERIKKQALEETEREIQSGEVQLNMVKDKEIFLGGTKPMSQYIAADGTKWLAKQAVTCVGTTKLTGAYLTEIGANVQRAVDADTAVDAFVGQTKKHGVVSFQRRLDHVVSSKELDLFKFSKHPELATKETIQQVEALMPQILREHVTDWILCNFDTKGENFILTQEEGKPMVLHGIDKEAAFNQILNPNAQHMRTDYKPHANNTLYNVVFEKFATGEMNFDLRAVIPYAKKIIEMSDDAYLDIFRKYTDYLEKKAGDDNKKLKKVQKTLKNIMARKDNLQEEYINFFTELIERRCQVVSPKEAAALRLQYYGEGGKKFLFT